MICLMRNPQSIRLIRLLPSSLKRYCTSCKNAPETPEALMKIKDGDETSIFRTVTTDDIINFAKLTNDYNPQHFNPKGGIVHGALLNGFVSGVLGTKLPGPGTIVLEQNLKFPNPCYSGDTVEVKVHITSARKIILCEYTCIANAKKIVLQGDAKLIQRL